MAIESVNVINIQTKEAEGNVGSLKQRIKEMREALVQLQEGTDEYNKKAAELGNLMHQQSEAIANAKRATADFGQNISNTTAMMNGGVAAITGMTSALSLMGVEMGDETKLQQDLVKAIALMSSLSSFDAAIKGYKGLNTVMKTAIETKKAEKVAALAAAAATTADATASTADAAGKTAEASATTGATAAQWSFNAAVAANPLGALIVAITAVIAGITLLVKWLDKSSKETKKLAEESKKASKELEKMKDNAEYQYRYAQACGASTKELNKMKKASMEAAVAQARLAFVQADAAYKQKDNEENLKLRNDAAKALVELKRELKIFTAQIETDERKAVAEAEKNAADKAKAEKEAAMQKAKAAADASKAAKAGTIDEMEATLKLLQAEGDELEVKKQQLLIAQAKIKTMKEGNKDYLQEKTNIEIITNEIEKLIQKRKEEAEAKRAAEDKARAKQDIDEANSRDELFYQQEKNRALLDSQKDYNLAMIALDMELVELHRATLEDMYANDLISKADYELQKAKYDEEEIQLEKEKAERIKEINDKRIESSKLINKEWYNNIDEMSQQLSGLLGGIADNLDEDTAAYKNIKAAQAIINTLSAAVAAFSGITETTKGWGVAAAIAQAAAVTATGMATVRKIYAVNTNGGANSTSSSMTTAGVNTLTRNYTNTRLTDGSGAEIDLGGEIAKQLSSQKVYVTIGDIMDAQKQVSVTTKRNTF